MGSAVSQRQKSKALQFNVSKNDDGNKLIQKNPRKNSLGRTSVERDSTKPDEDTSKQQDTSRRDKAKTNLFATSFTGKSLWNHVPVQFRYNPSKIKPIREEHIQAFKTDNIDETTEDIGINSEEKQVKEIRSYQDDGCGLFECSPFIFRNNYEIVDQSFANLPEVTPFNQPPVTPFTDHYFGPNIAVVGHEVEWKRPKEFCTAPVFRLDKRSSLCLGHEPSGTSWFLSLAATLRDSPALFRRVVPEDAWDPEEGTFYCFFWKFGKRVPIYTDDFLPIVNDNQLWGTSSVEDENEMWPPLLEKALARHYGNYNALHGGYCGDIFQTLFGGFSEYIDFDYALEADVNSQKQPIVTNLHYRLKNACRQNDCILVTELAVNGKSDGCFGLVKGHAYTVTAIVTEACQTRQTNLVRIDDPSQICCTLAEHLSNPDDADSLSITSLRGGVWVTLNDFIRYFSGMTICSTLYWTDTKYTPSRGLLKYCTPIFGAWFCETAAGFHHKVDNPRFMFRLTDDGMDADGYVAIVVQICQNVKHMKYIPFAIGVDLYKILGEEKHGQKVCVMQLFGESTNVYFNASQISNQYRVKPGYYAVVPSNIEMGKETEFLIRLFTAGPVHDIREIDRGYSIIEFEEMTIACLEPALKYSHTFLIKWRAAETTTDVEQLHSSFYRNPRFNFEIPDIGDGIEQLVNFMLVQERRGKTFPFVMKVFKVDNVDKANHGINERQGISVDITDTPIDTAVTHQWPILKGLGTELTYKLTPGKYCLLLHMLGEPSPEKCLTFNTSASCALNLMLEHFSKWGYGHEDIPIGETLKEVKASKQRTRTTIHGSTEVKWEQSDEGDEIKEKNLKYLDAREETEKSHKALFDTKKLYYQLKINSKYGNVFEDEET